MTTWRDALHPIRMERIAIVAPKRHVDEVLALVAASGTVELSTPADALPEVVRKTIVVRDDVAAFAGWMPATSVSTLSADLAPAGGAVVPLARPRGVEAPSLLRSEGLRRSLSPLVETYGPVPYSDIDPTPLAAGAYVVMFGMMFGDVGHGMLLICVMSPAGGGASSGAARLCPRR